MGSERGFVSVRLLVLLGLVVAAVWVRAVDAPAERADPTDTSAGPTAGGPTGTGEPAGAPAVVSPASDPVSDPIRKADDVQA